MTKAGFGRTAGKRKAHKNKKRRTTPTASRRIASHIQSSGKAPKSSAEQAAATATKSTVRVFFPAVEGTGNRTPRSGGNGCRSLATPAPLNDVLV
jgi:hypothetical protein